MRKNITQRFCIAFFVFIFSIISISTAILNPVVIKNAPVTFCSSINNGKNFPAKNASSKYYLQDDLKNKQAKALGIKDFFKGLFRKDNKSNVKLAEKRYVYLGGFPLGFTIMCNGVVVVAISNDSAKDVKEGDVITKINGQEVSSVSQILGIINSEKYRSKNINIEYFRGSKKYNTTILPIYDDIQKIYKLGLWVRDNAAGVGTITYIRKDNLRFGALGHPVCDIDTGSLLPAKDGNIFKCNIVGYKKGVRGSAGELKGLFLRGGSVLGILDTNNEYGVFGKFDENFIKNYNSEIIEVASRDEVKSGKAKIRCTIDGNIPQDYEIEIVRTYFQSTKSNKSMFIRVTDKRLLSTTGGIIQGMSGSPIIQNGKLVGAVTHVFVSDPTKGYGIYADWMVDN